MNRYFEVKLIDGSVMNFDKKCDDIDYNSDPNYVIFKSFIDDDTYHVLAVIPHRSILSIVVLDDEPVYAVFNAQNASRSAYTAIRDRFRDIDEV